jgi:Family of unknown function (DUF6178)
VSKLVPHLPTTSPLLRLLEAPGLAASIQQLPAPALGRLIDQIGLEDAGEIVALATTEQLTALFDEDVWRASRPGRDEVFDPERFALWLEVMLEAGDVFTAARVTELDPDLVTLAVCKLAVVVEEDRLREEMAGGEDEALIDKALESSLCQELGTYLVIGRKPDAWDALVTLLVALDENHHDFLAQLLERAAHISANAIEESGGLYEVLTAAETLEEDAQAARDGRRSEAGHVTAADARSFLALAELGSSADALADDDEDPVTRAYFRAFALKPARPGERVAAQPHVRAQAPSPRDRVPIDDAVAEFLAAEPPRAALPAATNTTDPFTNAMAALRAHDPALHERRLFELNYLANTFIAAVPFEGRRFRPIEAGRAVLAVAGVGLSAWQARLPKSRTPSLAEVSAVKLFRIGWHALAHDPKVATNLAPLVRRPSR